MSWYQENKFAATLLGVTAVVSGALVYLGMGANSDATAARKKEQSAVTRINNLQAAKPYPSEKNEGDLAKELKSYAADAKEFQKELLQFRPEALPVLSGGDFADEVSKYVKKLKSHYASKNVSIPDKGEVYFGMEEYSSKMATKDGSTRYLDYQRQALDWLFTSLADSGIDSLDNVHRALAAEALANAPKKITSKKKGKKKGRKKGVGLTSVYDGLPIEITFTGTEASLQEFLSKVVAGDKYFFAVKILKIRNEDQDTVTISRASFSSEVVADPAVEDEFDVEGFATDDEDGDFGMEIDQEIIKQVIGDEKITVLMQLELVLFKEGSSVPLPRLGPKKGKLAKEATKKTSTK